MPKNDPGAEAPAETLADTVGADTISGGAGDELDPSDPALTGIPRDETHDSIDRHTGTLTDDAVAKRAELASPLPPPD